MTLTATAQMPRHWVTGIPGLVWAYRFGADGSPQLLRAPVDEALLDLPHSNESWLWLHSS